MKSAQDRTLSVSAVGPPYCVFRLGIMYSPNGLYVTLLFRTIYGSDSEDAPHPRNPLREPSSRYALSCPYPCPSDLFYFLLPPHWEGPQTLDLETRPLPIDCGPWTLSPPLKIFRTRDSTSNLQGQWRILTHH
jgi:hypothetical protein